MRRRFSRVLAKHDSDFLDRGIGPGLFAGLFQSQFYKSFFIMPGRLYPLDVHRNMNISQRRMLTLI